MVASRCFIGGMAIDLLADICPHLVNRASRFSVKQTLTIAGSYFLSLASMPTRATERPKIDYSTPSGRMDDINLLYWLALELVEYTSFL